MKKDRYVFALELRQRLPPFHLENCRVPHQKAVYLRFFLEKERKKTYFVVRRRTGGCSRDDGLEPMHNL